jgi:hypothetical protein
MNLPRNPFAVAGSIRQCWLFVYRLPLAAAQRLLPPPLRLVVHGGFAFMNIVVCRLSGMRPAILPAMVGLGYWHVAYRLHAWAPCETGRTLEGLHFLRSDCDRRVVAWTGNRLTDFNFHTADVRVVETENSVNGDIDSPTAPAHFLINRDEAPTLAAGSPFSTLESAAAFLKYKPYGLSVENEDTLQVVRVRREEAAWRSRVVVVREAQWRFLDGCEAEFELCYEVEPIDYRWERGHRVRVKPCA